MRDFALDSRPLWHGCPACELCMAKMAMAQEACHGRPARARARQRCYGTSFAIKLAQTRPPEHIIIVDSLHRSFLKWFPWKIPHLKTERLYPQKCVVAASHGRSAPCWDTPRPAFLIASEYNPLIRWWARCSVDC